jgi:hypothetical protein
MQLRIFIVVACLMFLASADAEDQFGQCLAHGDLLGDWEWNTENHSPTSPKGDFTFTSELNNNVVTLRASRVYPDKQAEFKEMFVIYRDTDKQASRSMYFDNVGHSSQCAVETSASCVVVFTCRGDKVHMRYVFGRRDGKPYFQWQVPPPHHHSEFAPYLTGFLERKEKRKDQ